MSKQQQYEELETKFNAEAALACIDTSVVLGPFAKAKWTNGWVTTSIPSPTRVNLTCLVQIVNSISGGRGEVIFRMAPGAYAELQITLPMTAMTVSSGKPLQLEVPHVTIRDAHTPQPSQSHHKRKSMLMVMLMGLGSLLLALIMHDGNHQVWIMQLLTNVKTDEPSTHAYQF